MPPEDYDPTYAPCIVCGQGLDDHPPHNSPEGQANIGRRLTEGIPMNNHNGPPRERLNHFESLSLLIPFEEIVYHYGRA